MALKNPQTSNVGGVQIHVDSAYDNIKLVADNITELLALETYFKEMNGIYLGTATTNPTLRGDSSALQNGDHYYNSSSKLLYKYISGSWVYNTVFYNETDLNAAVGTGPFNIWIAYADTVLGAGISTLPSGKEYIGFASGKTTSTVNTSDPSIFTWTDFKGDTGATGSQGVAGDTGNAGNTGATGTDGSTGSTGALIVEAPIIPANVTINVTSSYVLASWNPPGYAGHDYTKVYRASWDGSASVPTSGSYLKSARGDMVDGSVTSNSYYYYWFSHVNINGAESGLHAVGGIQAQTLTALESQTGWLSTDNLDSTLTTKMGLVATTNSALAVLTGNHNTVSSSLAALTDNHNTLDTNYTTLNNAYLATALKVGDSAAGLVMSVDAHGAHTFIKTNVNGHIAGFGLSNTAAASTASDGSKPSSAVSQFAVLADEFVIAHPASSSVSSANIPFRIAGGVTYIKEAFIENITAAKLTAGTIASQNIYVGSNAFNISGAAQGTGKGSLVVTGAGSSKVTLGYITSSTIGLEIKDVAGTTVLDHQTLAADMRNASQQWSDVQGIPTGIVQTFYQANAPTSGISVGDYWIDSDDRKTYRLTSISPSVWTLVQDQDIIDALANAATAQATADGKVLAFYSTTPPTVDNDALALTSAKNEGDLWFDTDDGNKMYKYVHPNWVATDDTRIGDAVTAAGLAQDTADGKINSYYTTTAPTIISNPELSTGDFWVDTNASANRLYRWSGSAWVDIKDASITAAQSAAGTALSTANTAQDTADGKVVTFVQETEPTSEGIGDLWFDTSDENKLYRSTVANSSGDWVPYAQETADWTKVYGNDKPDDNATVGAIWGSTINGQPSDTALLNSNTTPTDIGFTGALNANYITNNNQLTNGSGFNGFTNTNQLTDGAGLGTTAAWGSVSGISDWAGLSGITVANASTYIASAAITNAQIGNLDAGKINAGYISAARIAANTINTNMIAADAITADKIVAGAITAGKLSVDSIVATNITADAITTAKINGSAVGTTEIANFAVTNIWTQSTGALNLTPNTTSLQSVCNITQTTTNQGDLIITAGVGLEMYVGEYDDFYITAYLRQGSTNLKVAKVFSRNRVDIHDSNQATVVTSLFIEHTITSPSGSNAYRLYLALTPLTGSNSTTYPTTFKRNWGSMKLQQVKK